MALDKLDIAHEVEGVAAVSEPTFTPEHNRKVFRSTLRAQLAVWHANRCNKSILSAMTPWYKSCATEASTNINPLTPLGTISWSSWCLVFSGWFAWMCDGFDYFAVSLTVSRLAEQFHTNTQHITTAITLTLLSRSLGALIFGLLADRYGRKWTLVVNLTIIGILQIGSGLCQTYSQFLAIRFLFGIGMGGIWGQASATALENIPVPARGIISGFVQVGYSVGFLLAAVIDLTVVPKSKYTWRSLYFIGSGFTLAAAIVRACLPESRMYLVAKQDAKAAGLSANKSTRVFFNETRSMLQTNWLRWIWAVCFMSGLNFLSHGTADLVVVYLSTTKHFSEALAAKSVIIGNVGGVIGGIAAGYCSQFVGRRFALITTLCFTACWIPLWVIPDTFGKLTAGNFMLLMGVQGAWGIIPVYLGEIAPPAFRATFAGLAYQLGNMASAGSAQIEATAGEHLKLPHSQIPDYSRILSIFTASVIAWVLFCTLLGPEADGFSIEHAPVATQANAGETTAVDYIELGKRDVTRVQEA